MIQMLKAESRIDMGGKAEFQNCSCDDEQHAQPR
jgi:hypothetical protein